ncbi:unnamed protein product [Cyprideis torosa]|uniref:Uncharacterized protein n=1 Tax=Cyprideis torosa TaxID=163714 RepID=A0A7R8ZMC6_9CRUS|nr:unnamed protein product [Cyprideis torosa]CAG0884035.1 unnamed protein product [Cyprideis torosa]
MGLTIRKMMVAMVPQLQALWTNTTLFIRTLCCIILVGYALSFSESLQDALTMKPGRFMPPFFHIWTIFTSFLIELHWWEVLLDIVTLVLCGKLIEPLWGSVEFSLFLLVVNVPSTIITLILYIFMYLTSGPSEDYLYTPVIHGMSASIAGIFVAVKQMMPDSVIARLPWTKVTNRYGSLMKDGPTGPNLPLLVLLLSILLYLVGIFEGTHPLLYGLGTVCGWTYLRFYQLHPGSGSRGDLADTFSFASFFPNVLQPAIAAVSNSIFSCFVAVGECVSVIDRSRDTTSLRLPPSRFLCRALPQKPEKLNEGGKKIPDSQKALKVLNARMGGSRQAHVPSPHLPSPPMSPSPPAPSPPPSETAVLIDHV